MDRPHFVYRSSFGSQPACFYCVAVVNSAAMNMDVRMSLRALLSALRAQYPKVGSLDHTMSLLNFVKELLYCFPQQLH